MTAPDDHAGGDLVIEEPSLRGRFVLFPERVFGDLQLSAGAKLTYAGLLRFAWQEGSCFPGQTALAAAIGTAERSLQRYLVELRAAGFIDWHRRGFAASNVYRLLAYPTTEPALPSRQSGGSVPPDWPITSASLAAQSRQAGGSINRIDPEETDPTNQSAVAPGRKGQKRPSVPVTEAWTQVIRSVTGRPPNARELQRLGRVLALPDAPTIRAFREALRVAVVSADGSPVLYALGIVRNHPSEPEPPAAPPDARDGLLAGWMQGRDWTAEEETDGLQQRSGGEDRDRDPRAPVDLADVVAGRAALRDLSRPGMGGPAGPEGPAGPLPLA